MKQLFTLCLSLSLCSGIAHAQSLIYSQNFNTGTTPPEWTLNTTDEGSVSSSDNQWVINNAYAGGTIDGIIPVAATDDEPAGIVGAPESYYLHILSQTGVGLGGPSDCNFDAGMPLGSYFAAMTIPISTAGYSNVYFSFWWLCDGDAACNGKVWYRTSTVGTWTQIPTASTTFYGTTTWANDSFHIAAFDNQDTLEFGFQFTNGNSTGNDPAFAVDDISVYGTPASVTPPTASFISPDTAYCQNSCELFTSTTTGTVTGLSWTATGAIVESPTSDTTTICFLAAGTYSVTLTATNTGGSNSFTSVITVNPAPSPVITQSGNVLSVASGYTSYQWYTGLTPITGATTNSYTITTSGLYGVAVDSAGCTGYDTLTAMYTTGIANISNTTTNYWIAQSNNSSLNINASASLSSSLDITVFDATGRKVINDTWNAGSLTKQINGISVPSGMYIIKLSNDYTSTILKWLKP